MQPFYPMYGGKMSIIYDALKKIEKVGSGTPAVVTDKQKNSLRIIAILFLPVVISGVFAANKFFDYISRSEAKLPSLDKAVSLSPAKTQALPPVKAQTSLPDGTGAAVSVVQPAVKQASPLAVGATSPNKLPEEVRKTQPPELTLSGIVRSADSSFALINNRVVKIGDKISGATVMQISESEVELKIDDLKFKLSLTAKSSY